MTPRGVVVVGDVATDVIAVLAETPAAGSDAAARVRLCGGGAAGNVASWLAVAGVAAHCVARIGDDAAGGQRRAELAALGVTPHLAVDRQRATAAVVVLVADDGERTMFTDRGASLALAPSDIPVHLFRPGAHLHLSGYALLHPGPHAAASHALQLARAAGMTVSVDPSSLGPLRRFGPARFLAETAGADLCLPNAAEARLLVDGADAVVAARRLSRHYGQVVVSLGADGALWTDGDRVDRVPAAPAEVTDTTGAGDAFAAGFLAAWLAGAQQVEALRAGCGLAAAAVAEIGARPPPVA